jgi:hypothetical protein
MRNVYYIFMKVGMYNGTQSTTVNPYEKNWKIYIKCKAKLLFMFTMHYMKLLICNTCMLHIYFKILYFFYVTYLFYYALTLI